MYRCLFASICIFECVNAYTCMKICAHLRIVVHENTCLYVCFNARLFVCVCRIVWMNVCSRVCMCMHMCAYICIQECLYALTNTICMHACVHVIVEKTHIPFVGIKSAQRTKQHLARLGDYHILVLREKKSQRVCMRWRLVGSLKTYVSFAKESCKRDYILQKRPKFLKRLVMIGSP